MYGPGTLDEGHTRRSIYFMIKRSKLVPMMQLFDQPEPLVSVGDRPSTTIAPQALAFINSPHVRGYAACDGRESPADPPRNDGSGGEPRGYRTGPRPQANRRGAGGHTVASLTAQSDSYSAEKKPNAGRTGPGGFLSGAVRTE